MGAYIVGLNKPENEKDCNFYEEVFMRPFPYCHLIHKSCAGLEHCPIIEIREPHGRLIDADAALKNIKPIKLEDQWKGCTIETTKRLMMRLINDAPTIIPATEEGKA